MKAIKKKIPSRFLELLTEDELAEQRHSTYYLIDEQIYISSPFSIAKFDLSSEMLNNLLQAETVMIQDLQAKKKTYKDKEGQLFFDLFEMGLWFLHNLNTNDWMDLLNFWRDLMEENHNIHYINIQKNEAQTH